MIVLWQPESAPKYYAWIVRLDRTQRGKDQPLPRRSLLNLRRGTPQTPAV